MMRQFLFGEWLLPLHLILVGFLPFIGAAAGALGSLLGGGAKGAASERGTQNQFNLGQDQLRNQQYGTQQQALLQLLGLLERAQLERSQIGRDAPAQRTRQAVLGSMLQNMQPARIQAPPGIRMGQISGGLNPGLLNPQARQAGGELQRQALMALLSGSDVPQMPDTSRTILNPPQLSQYRKAGKGESLMGILGLIGSGAGLLGGGGLGGMQQGGGNFPGMTPPFNPRGF